MEYWWEPSFLSVMTRVTTGLYSAMVLQDTVGVWTIWGRREQEPVPYLVPHLATVTLQVNTLYYCTHYIFSLDSRSYSRFLINPLSNCFNIVYFWWKRCIPMLYLRRLYGSKRKHLATWSGLACHCVLFWPQSETASYFSLQHSWAQPKKTPNRMPNILRKARMLFEQPLTSSSNNFLSFD